MTHKGQRARFRIALMLSAAAVSAATTTSRALAADAAPGPQIEAIVVTAQKRETVLERTPETVSAVKGDDLARRGAANLADLTATIPNLSFSSNFGISQIFIRGIGNNFYSPGGDPGVAFYSDGAYVSDQEATNIAFFDVQRVEVLRGPQGALYGRNATGGAVNVISNSPTDDFEGRIGLVAGDYGRVESEGFLSGPLGGGAAARLSYQVRNLDGFTKNDQAGTPGARSRFDDLQSQALRLQTVTPTGYGGTLRLMASYYHQKDNGPAEKVLPDVFPQPAFLLFGVTPTADQRNVASQFGGNKRDVGAILARYDQPLGANEFTVIASYRNSRRQISYDQDGTSANQSTVTLATRSHDFNFDTRIASPQTDRFQWLLGATYVDFTQNRVTNVFDQIPLGFVVPGAPLNVPFPVDFSAGGEVRTRSAAAYADLHYALSERVNLSGGLRYTTDHKSADEFVIFLAPQTATPADRWSNFSGKIGLEYRPTDTLLTYVNLARGFKSGAINLGALTPPVRPETVTNVEVGLKASLWDRRAQLNLAAFASDYSDLQVLQIGPLSQILSNAAKAKISGFEAEGVLKPTVGLTLRGTFSYNDATYDRFVTPDVRRGLAAVNVAGNQLPLVSKTQASVGVEYAHALSSDLRGTLGADYAWRDRYFFTEFNTADAAQKAYGKLDLAASIQPRNDRWRLYAYLRNATNETAVGSMAIVSPLLGSVRMVNLIPPRHFGVGLEMNF
jgi:iron complex outermembrane receptor protein